MQSQAPFVDVKSFTLEEASAASLPRATAVPAASPFLALYEAEDGDGMVDAQGEDYVTFLNELYDDEFDDSMSTLVDEAAAIYEAQYAYAHEDPQTAGYQAERLLSQHFAPLAAEAEAMLAALGQELCRKDLNTLGQGEIDTAIDRYQPAADLAPSFEQFFGKLKDTFKKVAGKAVSLAKQGISAAAQLGLGPIFAKLKALVKPLLKRVIQTAIGKLPAQLQPMARKLAERLPFLNELEVGSTAVEPLTRGEVTGIQHEFNRQVANLLYATGEVEQDLELAHATAESPVTYAYPVADLDRAREQFVGSLQRLRQGEDPTPHVEEFLPALLPALKLGMKLAGRKRVVGFLAKLLGRLIQKFVGPQYAPALSQAIVDAGLRLIHLEATPEDEARAAATAVAATIEDTVRRAAAAPEYILADQELFEGFALEAFEQAAAANLPPVLADETYRRRPDLAEARKLQGTWVMMPRGRCKRYKKFSRRIPIRIMPHNLAEIQTFEGEALAEFLEEQMGMAPGEEQEAFLHLYESIPGTRLADIARLEENTRGLGAGGQDQLHPLTPAAAALLLGDTHLGREVNPNAVSDPDGLQAGQRLYYLEIPGKRPLAVPDAHGRAGKRRRTRVRLIFNFPANELRVYLFLSEIRAQEFAVKLRQHAHNGAVAARLHRIVERGVDRALAGAHGRLKIVHEAVTPDQWQGAMQRLPALAGQMLRGQVVEWVVKAVADHLKQRSEEFVKAAEHTADGVTLIVTVANPPGFPQLRQALKGKGFTLASFQPAGSTPAVTVNIRAGRVHE